MSPSQKLIAICPECEHETIYNGSAKRPRITCSECKTRYYIPTQMTQEPKSQPKKIRPSQPISPTIKEHRFIDDRDELLLSVAIRELNKPKPDPRWANILIACKKEKITNKGDDIESFRKLPNEILANLLNKSKLKTS